MNNRKITVIIKPTFQCNFRCQYCYHADTNYQNGLMELATFEDFVKKTFPYYDEISLIFHGGEPLLAGIDFYNAAFKIIDKYSKNKKLFFGLQTNGSLIDDKFISFFKKHDIKVSISFDGPGSLNSLRDQTKKVTDVIMYCKKKKLDINLLGVIHNSNINNQVDYYNFAKENRFNLKLNPIFKSGKAIDNFEYLLDAETYITKLKEWFLLWKEDESPLRIDPLFNLTMMTLNGRGHECVQSGCLTHWICLDFDGSLYPCGRSYTKEYLLGNITSLLTLDDAFKSENFKNLLLSSLERRIKCKENCKYFNICLGGCNNDCLLSGSIKEPNDFYCYTIKEMIPFIHSQIDENCKNPIILDLLRRKTNGKYNDK